MDIYLGDVDDEDFALAYDYLSLVSFLDASPALESFILRVSYCLMFMLQMYLIYVVGTFNFNDNGADSM